MRQSPLDHDATSLVVNPTASTPRHDGRSISGYPVHSRSDSHFASAVTPGKSSVRNGVSGRPEVEYMLQTGLSAQA